MRLNLGCGTNKLTGFINADVNAECKPDVAVDFTKPLPFPDNSVEYLTLFHTIEHVEERYHQSILRELHRILGPDGRLLISYPEFRRCAEYWLENKGGQRDFWKACIYGRQLRPNDFHVALMDTPEFTEILQEIGFVDIKAFPERAPDTQYTVLSMKKGIPFPTYEQVLCAEIYGC